MRNVLIIIKKQLKDTIKNKTILIQFLLFPIMTLIMEYAIVIDGMPELFFTKLFSIMYIGMAPLTSVAAIISEEKREEHTARSYDGKCETLAISDGRGNICLVDLHGSAGAMSHRLDLDAIPFYMCIMGIGFAISIVAGACIGIYSKNQMSATSVVMPVMMLLAFLPMLSMFNNNIAKVARLFLYTTAKDLFRQYADCRYYKKKQQLLLL